MVVEVLLLPRQQVQQEIHQAPLLVKEMQEVMEQTVALSQAAEAEEPEEPVVLRAQEV